MHESASRAGASAPWSALSRQPCKVHPRIIREPRGHQNVAPIPRSSVDVMRKFGEVALRQLQHRIADPLDEMFPVVDEGQVRSTAVEEQSLDGWPVGSGKERLY